MDAIVLAGGSVQPDDPLAEHAPGGVKCLAEVAGKPLVQWTLDALDATAGIDRVVVVGLPHDTPLTSRCRLLRLPAEGDMIGSIQAAADMLTRDGDGAARTGDGDGAAGTGDGDGAAGTGDGGHALVVAGDAPLIDARVLRWAVDQVRERDPDVALCAVDRPVMEARFPGSKRTYVRLADHELCGGDVAAVRLSVVRTGSDVPRRLSQARKQPWRIALVIGPGTLLALLLRRLRLAEAERRIGRRLGLRAAVLVCPYAEVAMDVDKPSQLALARAALEARHTPA